MLERFMDKVSPEPNSGCWLWDAYVSKDGYGRFGVGRIAHEAHRISYKLFNGEIPKDMCVDHICKIRSCVNPNHLRLLTRSENSKNQINANSKKTHCKLGHDLTFNYGRRYCKICQAEASKRYRKRNVK
jgi:hypothetical protein